MENQASDLAKLAKAWGSRVPDGEIAAFLALNAKKRAVAIARITSLQKLAREAQPSTAVQSDEAMKLGVGIKRLQGLMRAWAQPSIAAVTPHGHKVSRKSRPNLGREVAERVVAKALRRHRTIAEPTVHRRISRICERLGIKSPARMTVRKLLDQQRRALLPPDIARIENLAVPSSTPENCGELLIMTIEAFRGRLIDGDGASRPATALVLADIASEIVLAAEPGNDLVELGRSAADLLTDLPLAINWHRPRKLLLATPLPDGDEWQNRLRASAETVGIELEHELQRRIRRWFAGLWRDADGLQPASMASADDPPADWPTFTHEEFAQALDRMIASHNHATERIFDSRPVQHPMVHQFAEAAQDILSLFAARPAHCPA